MSVVFSKLNLFDHTALFCAVGLSISLVLVLTYDLRIADAWV